MPEQAGSQKRHLDEPSNVITLNLPPFPFPPEEFRGVFWKFAGSLLGESHDHLIIHGIEAVKR